MAGGGAGAAGAPLVGWLVVGDGSERDGINWVKEGLAETGLVEGQNFAFEYRAAHFHLELMPALAADLVRHYLAHPSLTADPSCKPMPGHHCPIGTRTRRQRMNRPPVL